MKIAFIAESREKRYKCFGEVEFECSHWYFYKCRSAVKSDCEHIQKSNALTQSE